MLHSILIVSRLNQQQETSILFSKHYDLIAGRDKEHYESEVMEKAMSDESVFCASGGQRVVVAAGAANASGTIVVVSGTGTMDEVLLALVVEAVQATLVSLLSAAGLSARDLSTQCHSNVYGMLSLSLDEMAPNGMLDSLDVEKNILAAKMKA